MPQSNACRHSARLPSGENPESGNVFLFILIGIVLFASISFVMSRGFRSEGTSGITSRKADLMATRLIDYSGKVQNAVDRALRNGCSEQELSFTETLTPGNPSAPPDGRCHIFARYGGPVKFWNTANEKSEFLAVLEAPTGSYYQRQIFLGGPMRHASAGDAGTVDIMMMLPDIASELCMAINRQLGITATNGTIPDSTTRRMGGVQYTGTFQQPSPSIRNVVDVNGNVTNHMRGCVRITSDTGSHVFNMFYAVLVAR